LIRRLIVGIGGLGARLSEAYNAREHQESLQPNAEIGLCQNSTLLSKMG
jgi:hypothetical protein